nr:type II toxin-antitoxin system RelE/ParE family toxin [Pseudomonas syringae]
MLPIERFNHRSVSSRVHFALYEVKHVRLPTEWISTKLGLTRSKARITTRVDRAALGHFGKTKPVGDEVFEMKLDFGPGFRVYYVIEGQEVLFLLGGGAKDRQQNDIDQAKALWKSQKVKKK